MAHAIARVVFFFAITVPFEVVAHAIELLDERGVTVEGEPGVFREKLYDVVWCRRCAWEAMCCLSCLLLRSVHLQCKTA